MHLGQGLGFDPLGVLSENEAGSVGEVLRSRSTHFLCLARSVTSQKLAGARTTCFRIWTWVDILCAHQYAGEEAHRCRRCESQGCCMLWIGPQLEAG